MPPISPAGGNGTAGPAKSRAAIESRGSCGAPKSCALGCTPRPPPRHGDGFGSIAASFRDAPDRTAHQEPGTIDIRRRIGQRMGNALDRADRAAELDAL